MGTKEKILEVALRQFNTFGTDAVTVRSIAQEVGISHGNLCYHFPNTDAIILALYRRIAQEMDVQILRAQAGTPNLEHLLQLGPAGFQILYRYKFLMLDFVRITRRIPQIQIEYRALAQLREQQYLQVFQNMIALGWLRPEPVEGYYQNLARRWLVFGDGWIPHAEIHRNGSPDETAKYYYQILISELLPLLTAKGRRLFPKEPK
ncbi:MAG TPA: TetR/AcrR family transcriptional regulator [Saprospiraceae bacterium]|nr:TetR/AcrR family transcriptional regulator [Saprospiraceae bacterium]HMP23061.1 TetR/AcrR family transcriptional regulator [Saprospiraceae bacterium]